MRNVIAEDVRTAVSLDSFQFAMRNVIGGIRDPLWDDFLFQFAMRNVIDGRMLAHSDQEARVSIRYA